MYFCEMKIANIVSKNTIDVSITFNVVEQIDDIIQGLPTLIVGYDYVNKYYPDFDITNIELETNLYWTFKRTEKRDKFEEDLEWFKNRVYSNLFKGVNYVFVDLIHYSNKLMWKVVRKIYSLKNKVSYATDDMIYIYCENLIFGINLRQLKYMCVDIDKIKSKIKLNSNDFLVGNKILIEYKKSVGRLGEQVKYIPFLYSITNGKKTILSDIYLPQEG